MNCFLNFKKFIIFTQYFILINNFLSDFVIKLAKYIIEKNYFINQINNKLLVYSLFYNLKLVELKILKFYIIINKVNKFIRLFKFSNNTLIFFKKKKTKVYIFILILKVSIIS